jgi:hypothetical protein
MVAYFYDTEMFFTLLDRVLRCDGSHTTFLHRQGDGKASSLSDSSTAVGDSRDIHSLRDLLSQLS